MCHFPDPKLRPQISCIILCTEPRWLYTLERTGSYIILDGIDHHDNIYGNLIQYTKIHSASNTLYYSAQKQILACSLKFAQLVFAIIII